MPWLSFQRLAVKKKTEPWRNALQFFFMKAFALIHFERCLIFSVALLTNTIIIFYMQIWAEHNGRKYQPIWWFDLMWFVRKVLPTSVFSLCICIMHNADFQKVYNKRKSQSHLLTHVQCSSIRQFSFHLIDPSIRLWTHIKGFK